MDENWDEEFGGLEESLKPLTLSQQPKSRDLLIHGNNNNNNNDNQSPVKIVIDGQQEAQKDLLGDDDFDFDSSTAATGQKGITIVGRQANLDNNELWDDDNDFDIEAELPLNTVITVDTRNSSVPDMSKLKSMIFPEITECSRRVVVNYVVDNSKAVVSTLDQVVENEAEEDWDQEIFGETVNRTGLGGLLMEEHEEQDVKGVIPTFHEFPQLKHQPRIIKYPKPPSLRTMKTVDGQKYIAEHSFESWITDLIEKHRKNATNPEIDATMIKDLSSKEIFSTEWSIALFHHYFVYYRQNLIKECTEVGAILFEEARKEQALRNLPNAQREVLIQSAIRIISYHMKLCPYQNIPFIADSGFASLQKTSYFFASSVELLEIESMSHYSKSYETFDESEKRLKRMYKNVESLAKGNNCQLTIQEVSDLKLNILLDLECINYGLSPVTAEPLSFDEEMSHGAESSEELSALDDLDYRLNAITQLYQQIPVSFLKAKGAYMLAMTHHLSFKDTILAEQYAFECLYILDSLPNLVQSSPAILSSIGYNALKIFADLLHTNQKQLYAIPTLCASVENLRLRRKKVNYGTLATIARMSAESYQYDRSVFYYGQALKGCQQSAKVNEIVHLTLSASQVLLNDGNLRAFENLILDSLSYLQGMLNGGGQTNLLANDFRSAAQIISNVSKLKLCLAEEYVRMEEYDSAIFVVEGMLLEGAFIGCFEHLIAILAKSYANLQWEREALEVLKFFKHLKGLDIFDSSSSIGTSHSVNGDTQKLLTIIQDYSHGSVQVSNSTLRFESYLITAEILFNAGHYPDGHRAVSLLLEEITDFQNPQLGEILFDLGTIYSKLRSRLPEEKILPQGLYINRSSSFSVLPKFQARRQSHSKSKKTSSTMSKSQSMADIQHEKSDLEYLILAIQYFEKSFTIANFMGNDSLKIKAKVSAYQRVIEYLLVVSGFEKNSIELELLKLADSKLFKLHSLKSIINDCNELLTQAVHFSDVFLTLQLYSVLSACHSLQKNTDKFRSYLSEFIRLYQRFFFNHSSEVKILMVLPKRIQSVLLCSFKCLIASTVVGKELDCFQVHIDMLDMYFEIESEIHCNSHKSLSDSKQQSRDQMFFNYAKHERPESSNGLPGRGSHLKLAGSKKSLSSSADNFQTFPPATSISSKSRLDITARHLFPDIISESSSGMHKSHENSSDEEEEDDDDSIMTYTAPFESKKSITQKKILTKLKNIFLMLKKGSALINGRYVIDRMRSAWADWEQLAANMNKSEQEPVVHSVRRASKESTGNAIVIFEFEDFLCFICPRAGMITWTRMTTPVALNEISHQQLLAVANSELEEQAGSKKPSHKKEKAGKKGQVQYTVVRIIFVHKPDVYALLEVPLSNSLEDCLDVIFASSTTSSSSILIGQSDGSLVSSDSASTDSSSTPPLSKSLSRKDSMRINKQSSEEPAKKLVRLLEMNQKAKAYIDSLKGGMFSSRDEFVLSMKGTGVDKIKYEPLTVNTRAPIGETDLVEQISKNNEEPLTFYFVSLNDINYPNGRSEAIIQTKRKQLLFVHSIVAESRIDETLSSGQYSQIIRELRTVTFGRIQTTLMKMYESIMTGGGKEIADKFTMPLLCSQTFSVYPWELIMRAGHIVRVDNLRRYMMANTGLQSIDMKNAIVVKSMMKIFAVYYADETAEYKNDRSRRQALAQSVCNQGANSRLKRQYFGKDGNFKTPFQSPLVKHAKNVGTYRKRYKYLKFIDLKKIDPSVRHPAAIVKSFSKQNYPVFLFTFADLTEMNEWTRNAIRSEKSATILFIPAVHFKIVLKRMLDQMDDFLNKSAGTGGGSGVKKTTLALESMSTKFFTPTPVDADMTFQLSADQSESTGLTAEEEAFWRRFVRQLVHSIQQTMEIPIAIYETKL